MGSLKALFVRLFDQWGAEIKSQAVAPSTAKKPTSDTSTITDTSTNSESSASSRSPWVVALEPDPFCGVASLSRPSVRATQRLLVVCLLLDCMLPAQLKSSLTSLDTLIIIVNAHPWMLEESVKLTSVLFHPR
jgi:hypothetical protein